MRDLILILILLSFILVSFRISYFMALGYLWVDFVQPQRLGYYLFNQIPVAMILGAGAVLIFLFADRERRFQFGILQALVLAIAAYGTIATFGWASVSTGEYKWDWVTKALVFSTFLPMVLTTRLRIEAAIAVMIFSIAAITVSAGAKTILGGGGYGNLTLLVDVSTGLYESSTLAAVSCAMLPVLWWFYKHNSVFPPTRLTFLITAGLTVASLLVFVGAEARTGLISALVLAGFIWLYSSRKAISGTIVALVAVISIPFLPASFTDRMATITNFEADQSAATRVAVWNWTWDYVLENPQGGGYHIYKANNIDVRIVNTEGEGNDTSVTSMTVRDRGRAFHSAYFEVLGELGFPGLALWLTFVALMYLKARGIRRRERALMKTLEPGTPEYKRAHWTADFGAAMAVFMPVYLAGALFVGIGFQPALFNMAAVLFGVEQLRKRDLADETPVLERSRKARMPKASGTGLKPAAA